MGGIFSSGGSQNSIPFCDALLFGRHTKWRYSVYFDWANWLDTPSCVWLKWLDLSHIHSFNIYKLPTLFEAHCHSYRKYFGKKDTWTQSANRWADVGGFLSPGCWVSIKFKSCNERRFVFRASHKRRGICYFISFPHGISNFVLWLHLQVADKVTMEWCMYWVFWNVLDTNRIISSCPGIATNAIVPNLLVHWTTYSLICMTTKSNGVASFPFVAPHEYLI